VSSDAELDEPVSSHDDCVDAPQVSAGGSSVFAFSTIFSVSTINKKSKVRGFV